MEDHCSHKSHNTRTRCHCVKLVGESFKTGKGKHFEATATKGGEGRFKRM